jgi:LmbE family N-acetylglucosaminyl deacetylase
MSGNRERVIAVGAHPDDIESIAGGTLALMSQRGFEIRIATVCSGNMGSTTSDPRQVANVRFREAAESAKIINASYETLGESDLKLVFDNATRSKVVELVRRTRPDIVFTHFPQDYMPDHQITADLVWDACFNAQVPNYFTNQAKPAKPTNKIPYLYYGDGIEGLDRLGSKVDLEFYVDISSVIEIKEKMLKKHESQRFWLKAQHGMDQYILTMRKWSAERGGEANVRFAEGFIQHKGHPFPTTNILEKVLRVLSKG